MSEQTTPTPAVHGDRARPRQSTLDVILHYAAQQYYAENPDGTADGFANAARTAGATYLDANE